MGRRIDTGDNEVSLFPFLSILACVIGVLTLMISTLALSQMDNEVVVAAEEYEQVEEDLKAAEVDLAETQKNVSQEQVKFAQQATRQQKELAELKVKLAETLNQFSIAQKKRDELIKADTDGEVTQLQPLKELEDELGGLKEQIAQLTKELEAKNLPPEEAEVSVLPGGSGVGFTPFFVECTKNELVIHTKEKQTRVRAGNMEKNEAFIRFMDEAAGSNKNKVIFLIRDDGVHVWWRARNFANSLEVANGKLPVLGHGKLKLDHFYKK